MWVSLPKEKINDLPFPAIFVSDNESSDIALITKSSNEKYILSWSNGALYEKEIDLSYFTAENYVFFLFEKSRFTTYDARPDKPGVSKYLNIILVLTVLGTTAFMYWVFNNIGLAFIWMISLIGVYIFNSILKYHFTRNSNIISTFCKPNGGKACAATLNYKFFSHKILDLKLMGLVYFMAISLATIFSAFNVSHASLNTLFPIAILGLIGIVSSIYLQIFKLKVICKICLFTSFLILLSILVVALDMDYSTLHAPDVMMGLVYISLATIMAHLYYTTLESRAIQDSLEASLVVFKSDPEVFKSIMRSDESSAMAQQLGAPHFYFGEHEAETTIGLVLSLKCKHCFHALSQICSILDASSKYTLKLWFASSDNPKAKEIRYFNHLLETKSNFDLESFHGALSKWYLSTDSPLPFSASESDNFIKGINITPIIFVNDNIVPTIYTIDDIKVILMT